MRSGRSSAPTAILAGRSLRFRKSNVGVKTVTHCPPNATSRRHEELEHSLAHSKAYSCPSQLPKNSVLPSITGVVNTAPTVMRRSYAITNWS